MSAQQTYDEIGEAFEVFKALPLAQYVEAPSFLGLVGDVAGEESDRPGLRHRLLQP